MTKKSFGAKTIVFPTPAWVVCAYDRNDKPTGMTAAWGGVTCSEPPCVGVSIRKSRYTYQCIVDRRAFTVCVPSEDHIREVDYFGIVSGRDTNKFMDTGLTAVRSDLVDAPYIKEFPMILECRLLHTLEIGVHTQFVGEILDVKIDETVLRADGNPDIAILRPIVYAPTVQTYHAVGRELGRGYKTGKSIK